MVGPSRDQGPRRRSRPTGPMGRPDVSRFLVFPAAARDACWTGAELAAASEFEYFG